MSLALVECKSLIIIIDVLCVSYSSKYLKGVENKVSAALDRAQNATLTIGLFLIKTFSTLQRRQVYNHSKSFWLANEITLRDPYVSIVPDSFNWMMPPPYTIATVLKTGYRILA